MIKEFKTLDAPMHDDYYYKREDNYVDQYDDALYPETSLPPRTEIVTVPQTEQSSEETVEYDVYTEEDYEYEEYAVYDGGDGYYADSGSSSGSSFFGLGLIFVVVLLVAAVATVIALVVNDGKKKKHQAMRNAQGYQYPNNQQNYNGYNQNQSYPNNQQGYMNYNQNQQYPNGQSNPNNNQNYPRQ